MALLFIFSILKKYNAQRSGAIIVTLYFNLEAICFITHCVRPD